MDRRHVLQVVPLGRTAGSDSRHGIFYAQTGDQTLSLMEQILQERR
jgi:hypothetical protein